MLPIKINGKWYKSVAQAGREFNMNSKTLLARLRSGNYYSADHAVSRPLQSKIKIDVFNTHYESFSAMCRDYKVTSSAIYYYKDKGPQEIEKYLIKYHIFIKLRNSGIVIDKRKIQLEDKDNLIILKLLEDIIKLNMTIPYEEFIGNKFWSTVDEIVNKFKFIYHSKD